MPSFARFTCASAACAALALAASAAPAAAQFSFSSPVVIDNTHNAGEPGIIADPSGKIFVNAPGGIPGPSLVWRSDDGGGTWKSTGPGTVGANPSGPAANVTVGGGDANLATDATGNLYFIDLWLGNSSAAVSHDSGASWLGQPFGTMPIQDRPWISADPRPGQQGIVYSVTEQLGTGLWISRSVANSPLAGAVYPLSTLEIATAQRGVIGTIPPGNLATGMNGTTYNVYSTSTSTAPGMHGVGISSLPAGGITTTNGSVAPADGSFDTSQSFPVVAVDNTADNNVYVVWNDPTPTSSNIRFASSTDGGKTWSSAVTVGQGLFPWVTAQAPGKVDIGWYSAAPTYVGDPNKAPAGTQWNVDFAQSVNATSSAPTFTAPETAATNIKSGAICTQGTGCSADRELLDFMSIAHDSAGNALLAFTTVPSSGHSNIEFAKQTAGTGIG
jgi:hypothetical protein